MDSSHVSVIRVKTETSGHYVQFGAVLRAVKGDTEGWWAQCKDHGSCIELAELQIFVNDNGRVWSWRQLLAILQGACPAITEH